MQWEMEGQEPTSSIQKVEKTGSALLTASIPSTLTAKPEQKPWKQQQLSPALYDIVFHRHLSVMQAVQWVRNTGLRNLSFTCPFTMDVLLQYV